MDLHATNGRMQGCIKYHLAENVSQDQDSRGCKSAAKDVVKSGVEGART